MLFGPSPRYHKNGAARTDRLLEAYVGILIVGPHDLIVGWIPAPSAGIVPHSKMAFPSFDISCGRELLLPVTVMVGDRHNSRASIPG